MDLSKLSTSTSAQSIVGTPPKYSYKAGTYTIFNKETGQIETVDLNKIKGDLRSNIDNIIMILWVLKFSIFNLQSPSSIA